MPPRRNKSNRAAPPTRKKGVVKRATATIERKTTKKNQATAMPNVTIQGKLIRAVSPEGQTAEMTIQDLLQAVAPARMNTCGVVLPQGTELIYSCGRLTVLVHQTPPHVRSLKWIAHDSPKRWGGAKYRTVRVALPYLIVLAVFDNGMVSDLNECFFRVAPLESEDDQLLYPALLNCSRFRPQDGKPLSWICTQKLDRSPVIRQRDPRQRIRAGFRLLMHCLLETGFNWSSEDHEGSSWFSESTRVDARIASIEKWEQATEKEGPLFVLDVPWLKTGLSVKQVAERIFANHGARSTSVTTDGDLARIIFHHRSERDLPF